MKLTSTLALALICAPAALFAQQAASTSSATASATASANAQTSVNVPSSYSAQAKTDIEASFKRAHDHNVPDQAMRQRLAEGQAKSASDAQTASSVQKTEARLEASQSAMVHAGRSNPTPKEINSGEQAMASGASEADVEAVAKHAPADRSLVVAFDVLSKLEAQGKPANQAVATITAKLDANATDDVLASLTGSASATGAVQGNPPSGSAAAGATAGVSAAAKGAGNAAAGVGAAVTGAVQGVVGPKKP